MAPLFDMRSRFQKIAQANRKTSLIFYFEITQWPKSGTVTTMTANGISSRFSMPLRRRQPTMKFTIYTFLAFSFLSCGNADDFDASSAVFENSLAHFATTWKAADWKKSFRGINGYIRADDDAEWKARFLALRDAVAGGQTSIPPLMKLLREGSAEERVFAAQALSFLTPRSDADKLEQLVKSSPERAVRLYCVDALATLGEHSRSIDWESLSAHQKDRDVRKHIAYAIERAGKPVAKEQLDRLLAFKDADAGAAVVGELAPDFSLETIGGKSVELSTFRGKKPVVLVFIYGDT